jgi:hypothetical protein
VLPFICYLEMLIASLRNMPEMAGEQIAFALGARSGVLNIHTRIAIECGAFNHIAAGIITSDAIKPLCHGTEKSVRVPCDDLTVHGFLTKAKGPMGLHPIPLRCSTRLRLRISDPRVLHASDDGEQIP